MNNEALTVIVKSRSVDVDCCPRRDVEYSFLACLVPNKESSVLSAVLQNYRYLGLSQRLSTVAPGSVWPQHTGGNILKVSYKVLYGGKLNHQKRTRR